MRLQSFPRHSTQNTVMLSDILLCAVAFQLVAGATAAPHAIGRRYSVCTEFEIELLNLTISKNDSRIVSMTFSLQLECLAGCEKADCTAVVFEAESVCHAVSLLPAASPYNSSAEQAVAILSKAGRIAWRPLDWGVWIPPLRFENSSAGRNGSLQHAWIEMTGCYLIEAAGARGGRITGSGTLGGKGAHVSARVNLTVGTQLTIVVGQMGGSGRQQFEGGGGGGASFVYRSSDQMLLLAAGGGGGSTFNSQGRPGELGANGSDSRGFNIDPSIYGFGGANGQPGFNNPTSSPLGSNHGGCGAGWLGKAVNPRRSSLDGERGGGLDDGWVGGSAGNDSVGDGGFGGGGGAGCLTETAKGAPGAGGGFSGGGAGLGYGQIGGGGGSFCLGGCASGLLWTGDHGFVSIQLDGAAATCT